MSAQPALVILQPGPHAAIAGLAADRCLFFAQLVEKDAAIDLSLYDYMQDLADGAEAIVDQLPDAAAELVARRVARLQNALETRERRAAA